MKIAIASLGQDLNSKVSPHFGRAPYFIFAEIENNVLKKIEIKKNLFITSHEYGVIPGQMIDNNVDLVICAGIGERAQNHLERAGIRVCKVPIISVKDALEQQGVDLK